MAASVFDDKSEEPDSSELDTALGKTSPLLKSIEEYILDQFGALSHEWKFYGKQAGWTLAHESKLPNETKSEIDSARKYAEGRSVRLEVNSAADAEIVKQLVAVKLAS
jgi:hypothetical protein